MIRTYLVAVQRSHIDYIPVYVHTEKEQNVTALFKF